MYPFSNRRIVTLIKYKLYIGISFLETFDQIREPLITDAGESSDSDDPGVQTFDLGYFFVNRTVLENHFLNKRVQYLSFWGKGNLTALITARTSCGVSEKDYSRLAIIVSEEAHYSVARAAEIMGIPSENIFKVESDPSHRIVTNMLESIYQYAIKQNKIVFCVIGCAGMTAVGAYDDLNKMADFAEKHNIWFHVDGAHGAAVGRMVQFRQTHTGMYKTDHDLTYLCNPEMLW